MRQKEDSVTGEYIAGSRPEQSEFTEVKASGKDVSALLGAMKESSQTTLHQAWNRDQKHGVMDISDPAGKVVRIRANQEKEYRARGYGQKSTKASFSVQGFGRMRKESVLKQRVTYSGSSKRIWTLYKDGTETEEVA
jgi:hypothetical protein